MILGRNFKDCWDRDGVPVNCCANHFSYLEKSNPLFNLKSVNEESKTMKIGKDIILQSPHAKLLDMTFKESNEWKEHIYGTGGLISS